jgi:hypothetical protein
VRLLGTAPAHEDVEDAFIEAFARVFAIAPVTSEPVLAGAD